MKKFKLFFITLFLLIGIGNIYSQTVILREGDMAPAFTLYSNTNTPVSLADFRGKNVVLYFYPRDMSQSCTMQAINFRDNLSKFNSENTVVLGVSADDVASHQSFVTKENLNYTLLADPDLTVIKSYGVLNPETNRARRVTYVINPEGKIVRVYDNVDVSTNYVQILDYLGSSPTITDTQRDMSTTTTQTRITSTTQTRKTVVRKVNTAPYFAITPMGGAIFPIDRGLRDTFKPGWSAGIDLLYRINREVGIWGDASYNQMTRQTADDVGHYFEASIGPRYFFTHPRLKAQLFVDAGVGVYNLNQDDNLESEDPNEYTLEQIDGSKVGINGGAGVTLFLSNAISIMGKARYNTVFGTNENVSFLNGGLGLEFRFR